MQGIVKHARTGEPLAGARVTLHDATATPGSASSQVAVAAVSTDSRGEFLLPDIQPGVYRFSVGNNGFVRYDIPRLLLPSGENRKDMTIRLRPTGNLSGRVSTTAGKPAEGVTLNLLKRTFNTDGTVTYSTEATARTDDLGEYRMFWVTPGRYYLATVESYRGAFFLGGGGLANDIYLFADSVRRGRNDFPDAYTQTFYPSVTDFAKATWIDVQEGAELRGVDLTVARQQLFTVRGRVLDETGKPPAKAVITVAPRRFDGSNSFAYGSNYDPANGTFEITNLAPGRYGLSVRSDGFGYGPPQPGNLWGSAEIVITDTGIDDFIFRMAVPPVINGQVKVEGQSPVTIPLTALRVTFNTSSAITFFGSVSATPAADGSFKLNAIGDTPARIAVRGMPPEFYLKDARLDGNDVLRTPAKFSVAGNLEVTISAAAGFLNGRVLEAQSKPVADVDVVLIPNQFRERYELFKRATTGAQGRFSMAGIAPGDYKLFAWEHIEPNSFFDDDVLKQYEQQGTPVHIGESVQETMDIRIIPETSDR